MLKNVALAFEVLGALTLIFGVLYPAVRSDSPTRKIPWWWWLGTGGILVLLSSTNEIPWLSGLLFVLGGFAAGIGVTLLVLGVRDGRITLRPRRLPSHWEHLASQDWASGASLVRVLDVRAHFHLREDSPHIDVLIKLLNTNLHQALIQPDVQGRMWVPGQGDGLQELTHPPELQQIDRHIQPKTTSGQSFSGKELPFKRHETVTLMMRQHLVPAVRDELVKYAGTHVRLQMAGVDLGLVFTRAADGGHELERRQRERIPLEHYDLQIPGEFD